MTLRKFTPRHKSAPHVEVRCCYRLRCLDQTALSELTVFRRSSVALQCSSLDVALCLSVARCSDSLSSRCARDCSLSYSCSIEKGVSLTMVRNLVALYDDSSLCPASLFR